MKRLFSSPFINNTTKSIYIQVCAFESEKNFIQRTQLNNEMKYLLYLEKQQKEKIMVFGDGGN